jgi:hypothetical protein
MNTHVQGEAESHIPVAHVCNPGYSLTEITRIVFQDQPGQIDHKTLSP